jgi:hypothetical protein
MAASARTITPLVLGRHLSLRSRLILGYGIVVSLTMIFGLFMFVHLNIIRNRQEQLNSHVTIDARYFIEAFTAIADAQRQVDRYLLQPDDSRYRDAVRQFHMLERTIERLERDAHNRAMREHLKRIQAQASTYRPIFNETSTSITAQQRRRDDLYTRFLQQYQTIEQAISNA